MDSNQHIEQLLEKYWNCETSLEEEQQLRDYFSGGEFSGKLKDAAELFQYYQHQKKTALAGPDFDADVLRKIRANEPRGKSLKMVTFIGRIAAGLVVVAVAAFLVRKEIREQYPTEVVDTYSDPKLALEETKKALMMISKSFGKAEQEAKSINLLNEAEQKIGEKKIKKKEESNI